MRWSRLVTGLALAAVSGLVLGGTWAVADGLRWWAGGLTLLTGVLFALSAFQGHQEAALAPPSARPRGAPQTQSPAPLLGEMLVSQAVISRDLLGKALESQRGTKRRVGEILVQMGAISQEDLARALDEQGALRTGGFLWRGAR
jgi:hypothetical protein